MSLRDASQSDSYIHTSFPYVIGCSQLHEVTTTTPQSVPQGQNRPKGTESTMIKRFVLVLVAFFALEGLAFAQEIKLLGDLSGTEKSVTAVMQKAGVSFDSICQVLKASNIKTSDLRLLPTSQKIYISNDPTVIAGCTVEESRNILRMDMELNSAKMTQLAQGPTAETVGLRAQVKKDAETIMTQSAMIQDLKGETTAQTARINTLNAEVTSLSAELKGAQSAKIGMATSEEGATQASVMPSTPLLGLTALITIGGLGLVLSGRRRHERKLRNYPQSPLEHTFETKEGNRTYTLAALKPNPGTKEKELHSWYKCPHCNVKNILGQERNMVQHLTTHGYTKIVKVDPFEGKLSKLARKAARTLKELRAEKGYNYEGKLLFKPRSSIM